MKKLIRILVVHSATELLKYKSFFLLIFLLIIADRVLRFFVDVDRSALNIPKVRELGESFAVYIFEELPALLPKWILDYRTLLILVGLFLLKQIISLWPSSDMRRMHRHERESFGFIQSLLLLRWDQVLWDAIAVATICGVVGIWGLLFYCISFVFWHQTASLIWLIFWGVMLFLAFPIGMAGFSFSSKLAVLSKGSFKEKLILFFYLFINGRVFTYSWVFFLVRIVVEVIFVAAIPASAILLIDNFWLRIFIASVSATPVYSYLKMASFKMFLEVYRPYPLVEQEYKAYYKKYHLTE